MQAAELFGMNVGEFQSVMTILTGLNFMMIIYTIWLRKKIREAGDRIESNHKETMQLANTVLTAIQFPQYKRMTNYNKLTSKNEWYIFNLINLAHTNKNRKADNKLDILESFEVVGAVWCKRPEDVGMDYMLVIDGLDEIEKPA